MSDTPPVQFFTHTWAAGVAVGVAAAAALRRAVPPEHWRRGGRVAAAVSAAVETGLFVVVPVTAIWQAATALGWTNGIVGHVVVGAVATAAAVLVATVAWAPEMGRRRAAATAAVLAAGFATTGCATAALLPAVALELMHPRRVGIDRRSDAHRSRARGHAMRRFRCCKSSGSRAQSWW